MRFIVGTDWHLRKTKPAIRIDDFYSSQFKKLEFIFQQASSLGCPIMHNGDLFDVYDPPTSLVYEFISLVKKYNVEFYVNPGNHDLYGESVQSLHITALGLLYASEVVKFPNGLIGDCLFKATPYSASFNSSWLILEDSQLPKIALVHHTITSRSGLPYEHYPIETLQSNADLVICGHWHSQFKIQNGKTLYINSGPLTRQSKGEINVRPCVLLVDINSASCTVDPIWLPMQEDVFDVDRASSVKVEDEGVAEQFLSVVSKNQLESVDIYDLVKTVGSKANFDNKIVDNSIKTIQTVVNNW